MAQPPRHYQRAWSVSAEAPGSNCCVAPPRLYTRRSLQPGGQARSPRPQSRLARGRRERQRAKQLRYFFLDFNHGFGVGKACLYAGQFLLETDILSEQRLLRRWFGAAWLGSKPSFRAPIAQIAPFRHMRGIQAVAAQEGTALGRAARE